MTRTPAASYAPKTRAPHGARAALVLALWLANGLLLGALAHAMMSLWHQLVLKDGLLLRMLPTRRL